MTFDTYRPFIAKLLAPFIGLLVTALNRRYGIEFDQSVVGLAVSSLTDLVVFAVTTGIAAVGINKKINPANAASTEMVTLGKETNRAERIMNETAELEAQK